MTSSPVNSKCTPPKWVPIRSCTPIERSTSPRMSSKWRVFLPDGGHRVAVHGVAHPDHLSAIALDAFDQPFQTFVDRLHQRCTKTKRPGSSSGCKMSMIRAQSIRLGVVTNFDRHGVWNGGEVPHRAHHLDHCALSDPGQVGGKIPQAVAVALPGSAASASRCNPSWLVKKSTRSVCPKW